MKLFGRNRSYSNEITAEHSGEPVSIAGWVHEKRDLGGLFFLLVRDREGLAQVTLHKREVDRELFEQARKVPRESVVAIDGIIKGEPKAPGGYELLPKRIEVLSVASYDLPLDPTGKVGAELDTRLDARFMDLRSERTKHIFIIRSQVLKAIRDFLNERGFIEINTPKIVSAATEGGTALFPISYFEREAFLNQSPQLYKQMLIASGFDKVFEIAPIFRAEEHDTTKHLNEAMSVDIEVAFVSAEEVMRILEELIAFVYSKVALYPGLDSVTTQLEVPKIPFQRIRYDEAIELLADAGEPIEWGDDLSTSAEHKLGARIGAHYFITEWPRAIKPFYAQPIEDKETTNAFDLMHPRLELASGSQRVHSYELLKQNIESKGLSAASFAFYLDAFRYGMPPHAGWGLGVERLLMSMLGIENVREVVLFPRDRRRLVP
ncbi:MAG: aspartate--tRNA(Asn) ligase [Methanophagales archaeon ANME-1-THS]|nr:MAG: aspartate--tRNA(Asn) ligase [Methanophagales archaeon ANME-1-THS]